MWVMNPARTAALPPPAHRPTEAAPRREQLPRPHPRTVPARPRPCPRTIPPRPGAVPTLGPQRARNHRCRTGCSALAITSGLWPLLPRRTRERRARTSGAFRLRPAPVPGPARPCARASGQARGLRVLGEPRKLARWRQSFESTTTQPPSGTAPRPQTPAPRPPAALHANIRPVRHSIAHANADLARQGPCAHERRRCPAQPDARKRPLRAVKPRGPRKPARGSSARGNG